MKKYIYLLICVLSVGACKTTQVATNNLKEPKSEILIDLSNTTNDKVEVSFKPSKINSKTAVFHIPKIVPGTYSNDNYGKYISNFSAIQKNGKPLPVTKTDDNSWSIENVNSLYKITYSVNDTYDIETKHEIFSPSGTNILKDKNFVLNLHGFIGYFEETQQEPYVLSIIHPNNLKAATSSTKVKGLNPKLISKETDNADVFYYNRYAEVTDNPIMYTSQEQASFTINDIEILLSVYSPNNIYSAKDFVPSMKKMMTAQKNFMGTINSTKKYSILLYLSSMGPEDAKGFGALEHNNSTLVVLPETMPLKALEDIMIDVVSHEFFHIITPLSVHSKEIHDFNYNTPKMSEHLWMYEGTTEYFAQLFQIKENLISNEEFFSRMVEKIENAKKYNDTMSFTKMSKNILEEPYKTNYNNVYEKGALISMCLDIIIRKRSYGKKGILDLMKSLSERFGASRPFLDEELIDVIVAFTYPEVGDFLIEHVVGGTPINYIDYFNIVGLEYGLNEITTGFLMNNKKPYINGNKDKNEVFFDFETPNDFLTNLEVQSGDVIKAINGKKFDLNNAHIILELSQSWKVGDKITMDVERNGLEFTTSTTIKKLPTSFVKSITEIPDNLLSKKQKLTKAAWLH